MAKTTTQNAETKADIKSLIPPSLDVRKLIEQFKVPGVDMGALLESSRKDIEAVVAANEHAYRAMDSLVRRQAEILTSTLNEWQNGTKDLLSGKSPADTLKQQFTLAQGSFERALGNMRDVAEFVAKSHEEVTGIINRRVKENIEEIKARMQPTK